MTEIANKCPECKGDGAGWWEALAELRLTARLLLQNAEGCAVNHYGSDFELHGPPGWLADAENVIVKAEAALASSPTTDSEDGHWLDGAARILREGLVQATVQDNGSVTLPLNVLERAIRSGFNHNTDIDSHENSFDQLMSDIMHCVRAAATTSGDRTNAPEAQSGGLNQTLPAATDAVAVERDVIAAACRVVDADTYKHPMLSRADAVAAGVSALHDAVAKWHAIQPASQECARGTDGGTNG